MLYTLPRAAILFLIASNCGWLVLSTRIQNEVAKSLLDSDSDSPGAVVAETIVVLQREGRIGGGLANVPGFVPDPNERNYILPFVKDAMPFAVINKVFKVDKLTQPTFKQNHFEPRYYVILEAPRPSRSWGWVLRLRGLLLEFKVRPEWVDSDQRLVQVGDLKSLTNPPRIFQIVRPSDTQLFQESKKAARDCKYWKASEWTGGQERDLAYENRYFSPSEGEEHSSELLTSMMDRLVKKGDQDRSLAETFGSL